MPASPADSHARLALQRLSAPSVDAGASASVTEQTPGTTAASASGARENPGPSMSPMPTPDHCISPTAHIHQQKRLNQEPQTQPVEECPSNQSRHKQTPSRSSSRKEDGRQSSVASSSRQEPLLPLALRPQDMDGPPNFTSYTAQFSIIQQPDRARSCGNADRDRRCLDPPPVLKLEVRSLASGEVDIPYMKRYSWIVQCFLYSADLSNGQGEQLPVHSGGRLLIRGNMVGNAQYADLDVDGHRGESCYFCFPDLSFSTAGYYRLKFQWAWIDQNNPFHSHQVRSMGMMGFQISDVFRVYSAKDFPSMLPMTPISLALKRHGLWIRGGIQRTRRPDHAQQVPASKIKEVPELDDHNNADASSSVSIPVKREAQTGDTTSARSWSKRRTER
ncbi:velvet factor-domain-containing protein [Lipomyces tetrasporus]